MDTGIPIVHKTTVIKLHIDKVTKQYVNVLFVCT